jgi:hypothetical protein
VAKKTKTRRKKPPPRPKGPAPDDNANKGLDDLRPKLTRLFSEYIVIGYLKGSGEPYWYIQGQGTASGGELAKWAVENIRDKILDKIPPELPEEEQTSCSSTSHAGPVVKYYQPIPDQEIWAKQCFHDYMVYLKRENAEEAFPGLPIEEFTNRDIPNAVIMDKEDE